RARGGVRSFGYRRHQELHRPVSGRVQELCVLARTRRDEGLRARFDRAPTCRRAGADLRCGAAPRARVPNVRLPPTMNGPRSAMRVPTVLHSSARFLARQIPYFGKLKDQLAWKTLRHWLALRIDPRNNSTFTGFFRLPSQFEALTGPVTAFLTRERPTSRLRVAVIGCSNGAEAYSIASMLMRRHPGLEFQLDGYDINADMCEKARSGRYEASEVLNNHLLTAEFIQATFDVGNDVYRVKPAIAA